jgi:hypothetical protein
LRESPKLLTRRLDKGSFLADVKAVLLNILPWRMLIKTSGGGKYPIRAFKRLEKTIHLLKGETWLGLRRGIDEGLDREWDFAGERRGLVVAAWHGAASEQSQRVFRTVQGHAVSG